MMSEISTDKLIRAIKVRPALYNKLDARYHMHNKYRGKIWTEVCREVFVNWDQLGRAQKVEYGNDLQKRWKSLRTCFTRELALQKKERMKRENGETEDDLTPYKRRKKYEHFDAMSFLLNPDDVDEIETADISDEDSCDPLDNEIKIENFLYEDNFKSSRNIVPVEKDDEFQQTSLETASLDKSTAKDKLIDLLKDNKREEENDDRQFLLSLIPSFRKLSDKQKFDAKIEILQVLKRITFQDDHRDSN